MLCRAGVTPPLAGAQSVLVLYSSDAATRLRKGGFPCPTRLYPLISRHKPSTPWHPSNAAPRLRAAASGHWRRLESSLRDLGYDVLTSREALNANRRVPDDEVLRFATTQSRAVPTFNRRDFRKLHRDTAGKHAGIVCGTPDPDHAALAARIDTHIQAVNSLLAGEERRVVRPG